MPQHSKEMPAEKKHKRHEGEPPHHEKHHPKPHEKKPHRAGVGRELVGSPEELLELVFPNPDELKQALDQLLEEGPDHKQVNAALVCRSAFRLANAVGQATGKRFSAPEKKTMSIVQKDRDGSMLYYPQTALEGTKKKEVIETLAKAPEHEQILFSTLLQTIEWSISALSAGNRREQ